MDQDEPTERGESAGEVGAPMRTLLDTSSIPDLPDATMPRGAAVGRYVVLEKLGAGAMGVVYSAFDPELARKVALKLVRPRPGRRSKRARDRLLREAQAMARVDHRNVIGIHDVGTHHGRVFLAMEYVRGTTLREWQESERRTWEEVVAMYEQAGRGLEAAHRSGLVHRDFKPENALSLIHI